MGLLEGLGPGEGEWMGNEKSTMVPSQSKMRPRKRVGMGAFQWAGHWGDWVIRGPQQSLIVSGM